MDTQNEFPRPLSGLAVGISISEPDDESLSERGLIRTDINDITVELCRRLVALGAQVVLGHQWRPGGVMEAVSRFAQVYQSETGTPIIQNYLAFPDKAALSPQDRRRLECLVVIHDSDQRKPLERHAALRELREAMVSIVDCQLCLGGRMAQSEGALPGVVEEAALALSRGVPVYLSAFLGGAAEWMIRSISGAQSSPDTRESSPEGSGAAWQGGPQFASLNDVLEAWRPLRLAKLCGLSEQEQLRLFGAQNLDTFLQLATTGMRRRARFA